MAGIVFQQIYASVQDVRSLIDEGFDSRPDRRQEPLDFAGDFVGTRPPLELSKDIVRSLFLVPGMRATIAASFNAISVCDGVVVFEVLGDLSVHGRYECIISNVVHINFSNWNE